MLRIDGNRLGNPVSYLLVLRKKKLNTRSVALGMVFAGLIALPAAEPNAIGLSPEIDARIHAALEANYRLDFEQGAAELAEIAPYAEDHPMITFGDLLIEWWKVTAAVWEEDEAACQAMLAAADRSLAQAEALIERGDPLGEGHMIKGATLGLLGRWHIKNRRWWKSYVVGKEAKAELTKALEINPKLYDAYAGIGIYDYFVAKLPGIVRWLAFTGQSADPADGMRAVELSLEKGNYTTVGTRAALTLIQLRNELNPTKGLELADGLVADHPHSPFFGSLRLIALYDLNRPVELTAEAERQASLLAAGDYPSTRQAQVKFAEGLAHFRAGRWSDAKRAYSAAVENGHPSDPFATWAQLHLGNIADVQGDRREARRIYREVENALNRWGTERLAERYRKTPFDPAEHQVRLLPDG
ncbi:MAG: hypothetical protein SynsKO_13600 [Synoicihabitans sp.]